MCSHKACNQKGKKYLVLYVYQRTVYGKYYLKFDTIHFYEIKGIANQSS